MSSNLFFNMNPLDAYFINQSHNPGKLTFVNASFWGKRVAIHKLLRPFNFDLKTYPPRKILREVSRVSSLILRAKLWLAEKVLPHGNRFAARVCGRYFSEGEKRRPEIRLRFARYICMAYLHFLLSTVFKCSSAGWLVACEQSLCWGKNSEERPVQRLDDSPPFALV